MKKSREKERERAWRAEDEERSQDGENKGETRFILCASEPVCESTAMVALRARPAAVPIPRPSGKALRVSPAIVGNRGVNSLINGVLR